MSDNLLTARAHLAEASAEVSTLQSRRADLEAELAEVDRQLHTAASRVEPLVVQVRVLEREPQDRRQLGMLAETLRARLNQARRDSPTVRAVKNQLPHLDDESVSAAARLALVRSLLSDLADRARIDGDLWASASPRVAGREGS